jgi:hypothetical protein
MCREVISGHTAGTVTSKRIVGKITFDSIVAFAVIVAAIIPSISLLTP